MLSRLMTFREQVLLAGFAASVLLGAATLFYLRTPGPAESTVPDVKTPALDSTAYVPAKRVLVPEVPAAEPEAVVLPNPEPVVAAPEAPRPMAPREVATAIAGEVMVPGMYRLPPDARIQDLIDAAGGLSGHADTSMLNLSARLIDGTTLTIPARAEAEVNGRSIRAKGAVAVYNPPGYLLGVPPAPVEPSMNPGPAASTSVATASPAPAAQGKIDLNTAGQSDLEGLPGIGPALAQRIIAGRPYGAIEELMRVPGIAEKRYGAIQAFITVRGGPPSDGSN
ncbi:MAG: hypothetical protein GC168_07365 [Candidatus Hydrogenedens sp.]|nr:hypothetical protein [Candidatus Hydrogenedens sp.]